MNDPKLIEDVAHATTCHIVELVGHLLRPEERREFFWEVFARVQAGIEAYLAFRAVETQRLYRQQPGPN